jgi:hypothetical protein
LVINNRYGITLDSEWIEWAAKENVPETVAAAALLLICETRPVHEVVAKLTPGEFERVVDIVGRLPDHFPSGTLAALKNCSPIPARQPQSHSVSTDQARRQSTKPRSSKECGNISNPFGIALDQSWLRWAAAEGVSETVIAAVALLHERTVDEVVGKLTPAQLADVTRLVSRCPSGYPPGAYDALKALRNVAAEQPATRTTDGAGANRPLRRHMRASAELKRLRLAERTNRAVLSQHDAKYTGANAEKTGTHPGTLAETVRRRVVVDDLMKLGLSVRAIAAGSGIPRSSVHRAMQAVARAEAKKEVAIAEITRTYLKIEGGTRSAIKGG